MRPGQPIKLKALTFRRIPFKYLRRLRGKVGRALRRIGCEPQRELWEVEIGGRWFVVWDSEVEVSDNG